VELIVVDNYSDDETGAIAARHADRFVERGPERSAQRNRGVAIASGEYVLILDADMELTPGTIAECVSTAMQSGATAVVVPERTVGTGFVASCRALERRCYEGDPTIEAARFFARDAFQRAGGYDETLTGPEDWDLPARMRNSGEIIGRADNAMVNHHEGDLRLGDHLRKKYYYGQSFGTYVRRHPELARRQLAPIRPALLRNWRQLVAEPVVGIGVVALKVAEFGAGGLGLASTVVTRP
jgi:glycosyltransferase involved in cell wall biosynthesis